MDLSSFNHGLFNQFKAAARQSPLIILEKLQKADTPVDYIQFYNSVSTVYSLKIEGENIDYDSFFKHKFLKVLYQPDYTKKADDLYKAHEFIYNNKLSLENLLKAHALLSANLLPKSGQGHIRNTTMFVVNSDDRIEYVAADPGMVNDELLKLFTDIAALRKARLDEYESFYYAALIHLVFVKIHPFHDGNGRTARLLEKWFLLEKLGDKALAVQLEKNYYNNLQTYYRNIRELGLEYNQLDYSKSIPFLLMTITGLKGFR